MKCVQWAMTTCGSVNVLINNVGFYDEIGLTGNLKIIRYLTIVQYNNFGIINHVI